MKLGLMVKISKHAKNDNLLTSVAHRIKVLINQPLLCHLRTNKRKNVLRILHEMKSLTNQSFNIEREREKKKSVNYNYYLFNLTL
jgi:hypothetical protein